MYTGTVFASSIDPEELALDVKEATDAKKEAMDVQEQALDTEEADVPFLYCETIRCDSRGCEFFNNDHDLTVNIPKGAIREGRKVNLTIGVVMYGPFNFPTNIRPISPIIWLCTKEEHVELQEPLQIKLPHIHQGLNDENYHKYQACFVKADHTVLFDKKGQMYYQFEKLENYTHMSFCSKSHQCYGTLQIYHFCYLCIAERVNRDVLITADYCLAQQKLSMQCEKYEFHFFATFDLATCRKVRFQICTFKVLV